jgi:hypothetical protein
MAAVRTRASFVFLEREFGLERTGREAALAGRKFMASHEIINRNCARTVPVRCIIALVAAWSLAGCGLEFSHTQPGTSVLVATAKRGVLIPRPAPTPAFRTGEVTALRTGPSASETVADYFSKGNFLMQVGRHQDAIEPLEAAVRLDPSFGEAWNSLAVCYEKTGQEEKAMGAFKKSKTLSITP